MYMIHNIENTKIHQKDTKHKNKNTKKHIKNTKTQKTKNSLGYVIDTLFGAMPNDLTFI